MKSPFKFLDSYTKDDRDIFFGRDREIEELYQKVFDSKLLLVYGVSGTGKSSLIHCGLANKFHETDWLPLVIRRSGNIIQSMASEIKGAAITQQDNNFLSPVDFKKGVRSLYLDHYKPVFFILDQFEELFIFGDKEERKSFVQIVKILIESDLQCRLIFVMREEYMAGITEFERYIPTFFSNRVRIEKMSHVNAIETIEKPCKAFNINLEEGFAEALLEKLSPGSGDIELTYLQIFLDKIFLLANEDSTSHEGKSIRGSFDLNEPKERLYYTSSLLSQCGNVSDLLGNFLDEQISIMHDSDTALAVLKSFVSVKGTKRQMSSNEVTEYANTLGQPVKESKILEMLETFINLRILRDKDQNGKYEVRHDALATKIFEKITLVEKELMEIRQFIENAFNNYQKRKIFLSTSDFSYIAPYLDKMHLSYHLSQYIEDSRRNIDLGNRRKRKFIISVVVFLLLILSGFSIWALKEKNNADFAVQKQLESILTLNDNFEKIITNQLTKKNEIYDKFQMAYEANPITSNVLWDKALQIKKASDNLSSLIYNVRNEMISLAEKIDIDSAKTINLLSVTKKSDLTIPDQILFGKNKNSSTSNVRTIKQSIEDFKSVIYSQIDKKDWNKINFNIETQKLFVNQKGDSVAWDEATFKGTILAGAFTNLNNLITEVNYIEIDAINLLYSWLLTYSLSFNAIQPILIPQSTSIIEGDNYEAEALLSAYNTNQNMEAFIFEGKEKLSEADIKNSSMMDPIISRNGKIEIKIPSNKTGIKTFAGFISVKTPDGNNNQFHFAGKYFVLKPVLSVSPKAMNILYRGINNPMDIIIPGIASEKIIVDVTNGILLKNQYGEYLFKPGDENHSVFTVYSNLNSKKSEVGSVTFRIKNIPDPLITIGVDQKRIISVNEILSSNGLNVISDILDTDLTFKIIEFTIMTQDSHEKLQEERNTGNQFSEKQRILISNLEPGQYLYIKDISAIGPDSRKIQLNGIMYKIVK